MGATGSSLPYCGAPPDPGAIWHRWNLDPILIAVLLVLLALYVVGLWRRRESGRPIPEPWRRICFYLGWAVTATALISPLCALSVSLFAARISQHMILILCGAPLVAAGAPEICCAAFGFGFDRLPVGPKPFIAAALFAILLWFWHAPAPYAATFASSFVYWTMHVTLYGAAFWLWAILFDESAKSMSVAVTGLLSSVQMGFLGALITFAPRLLYSPHILTTTAWGFTPVQDQQLGGVIMWVPGCIVFLALTTLVLQQAIARAGKAWTFDKAASEKVVSS